MSWLLLLRDAYSFENGSLCSSLRTFLFLLFILLICRLLLPSGKSFTSISVKISPIPFLCLNSACHCLPGQFKFCSFRDARFSLLSLRAHIFLHPTEVAKQTFPYMSAGFGDKPCSERKPSSESSGGRSFQPGCGILSPAPCWFFLLFSYLPNSDKGEHITHSRGGVGPQPSSCRVGSGPPAPRGPGRAQPRGVHSPAGRSAASPDESLPLQS